MKQRFELCFIFLAVSSQLVNGFMESGFVFLGWHVMVSNPT